MTTMPIPAHQGDVTMPSHAAQVTQEPLTGLAASDARTPPVAGSPTYACGGCEIRWSGVSRAHCSACHRTFAGIAPFDLHRRDVKGVGTCVDPEQITGKDNGPRLLFLTNGLWSSVEDPKPRGQHLRRPKT